jgi:hypothetical protein
MENSFLYATDEPTVLCAAQAEARPLGEASSSSATLATICVSVARIVRAAPRLVHVDTVITALCASPTRSSSVIVTICSTGPKPACHANRW